MTKKKEIATKVEKPWPHIDKRSAASPVINNDPILATFKKLAAPELGADVLLVLAVADEETLEALDSIATEVEEGSSAVVGEGSSVVVEAAADGEGDVSVRILERTVSVLRIGVLKTGDSVEVTLMIAKVLEINSEDSVIVVVDGASSAVEESTLSATDEDPPVSDDETVTIEAL